MPGYIKRIVLIIVLLFSLSARNVLASNIPGVQTPIPISPSGGNNLINNGDFESGNADGVRFGNINRAVYSVGAASGTYWLDTSNCANCPSDSGFGNGKSLAFDVGGNFSAGQKYSASVYFRSPQGGSVRLAFWELGNTAELLGVFDKVGSGDWQKMEINDVAIRNGGNETLRVQIYINNIADNTNYSFDNFILSQAGAGSCSTSYYTYQQPLHSDAPTLSDLFDGKAHFVNINEADIVSINFNPSDVTDVWGQKMPILLNQEDGKYYAFTRGYNSNKNLFKMFLLSSPDGRNFTEVGPLFEDSVGDNLDGHIAIDYTVCPANYVMAIECGGSLCSSTSMTPFIPASWSKPVPVVSYDLSGHKSASTGVFLIDGNNKYASWTVIDFVDKNPNDPNPKNRDIGTESGYSRGIVINNPLSYLGLSSIGSVILPAEQNTHCTSSWDCNYRDKQDWKKEGNYYYLFYSGSNYYWPYRYPGDTQYSVNTGIGIARSTDPLGGYDLNGVGEFTDVNNSNDGSGPTYPVINAINGELYLYYPFWNRSANTYVHKRSKLVWNSPTPTITPIPPSPTNISPSPTPIPPTLTPIPSSTPIPPSPTPTPTPIPGDITGKDGVPDGKVDIYDYNKLISDFGKTGSAGFTPSDIDNNGKVIFLITIYLWGILGSEKWGYYSVFPNSCERKVTQPFT